MLLEGAQSLRATAGRWILGIAVGLIFIFLVLPILVVIPLSFNGGQFLTYPLRGVSLQWFKIFFTEGRWLNALHISLFIATASTAIATPLGTAAAFGFAYSRFPGSQVVRTIVLAPLIVPVIVYAIGLYFLLAPLRLTSTYTGLILGHAALGAPLVVVCVGASIAGFDWNLVKAGASLGATPARIAWRVVLPLIAPGVVFGALLAFAASLEEVVLALIVGGPAQQTLSREMFAELRENLTPALAAAAAVLMVLSVLVLAGFEILRRRAERLRGIGARPVGGVGADVI